jgi:iron complex transport system substrate-binding protein
MIKVQDRFIAYTDWIEPASALTRREFVKGAISLGALSALGACGRDGNDAPGESSATWSFVDDRGNKIERPARPERLVVYEVFLPALWELGLRPVGVLASMPLRENPDIAPVAERLGIDIDKVTALSTAYGEVNLETLAGLRPDLVVTYFNKRTPVLYGYADEEMQDRAAEVAPALVFDIHNSVTKELGRVLELAGALGAETDAPAVKSAKADFDVASERLRRIAAGRPGMKVLAAVPVTDGIFVAAPSTYTFTAHLQELGVDVFVPEDDSATVSWELAPTTLRSDAILLAAGSDYPTNDELSEAHPNWRTHPAVAAGQVASVFPNNVVPSHRALAALLNSIGDALEPFRSLD